MFNAIHHTDDASSRRRLLGAALVMALVVAAPAVAGAQGDAAATDKRALVGSWLETVTFPAATGRPPLRSLGTFHDDGTMTCSDQGAVTTTPPSVFTGCHGVWTHLERRRFAYTSVSLISDLAGNLAGYLKVRGTYSLSSSENSFTGASRAEIFDTGGNLLFAVDVTNAGQRIVIDLP